MFLYGSSGYSCHLFLMSSASARSIPFLSFIVLIFAWNGPWISLIFLKRSLVFPILLFSSISLHWSLRKAFSSPRYFLELCIQVGISFLFTFVFVSLLFTALHKASSGSHFAFLDFLFLRVILILVSLQCHEPPSIVHQALCQSNSKWIKDLNVHAACCSLQSCPTLCDSVNCSLPGSSVHRVLLPRILECVAMPSFGGSSQRRDQTHVSYIS